jgi:hypothetical protein
LKKAFELIESMATHHFQWSNERQVVPHAPGMHSISASDSIDEQLEVLQKQMASVLQTQQSSCSASSVYSMAVACDVCGKTGHASAECTFYANIGPSVSEVSYAQSQGSYNPSWKNHPNLSYRHSQPSQTLVSSQGQNYKNNQF